jgi:SEC-C motif-containing protein
MNQKTKNIECPCGGSSSNKAYDKCCGRFIDGGQVPANAADLMRSRYTAFALRNESYLRATWWPETLPEEAIAGEDDVKWIGLKIVAQSQQPAKAADMDADSSKATVEFIARFKVGGRAHKLHEISNFVQQADATGIARWYYVDGVFPEDD